MFVRPTDRFRPARGGFTIVELLIAMAVSILLMMILTTAFSQGLETFRKLKAQGDMQERLRTTSITLRSDLTAWHFTQGAINETYLSGQDLTRADTGGWTPPREGFFRIYQGSMDDLGNPFTMEGSDSSGLVFSRATTHALHFTVQRTGTGLENTFKIQHPDFQVTAGAPAIFFPRDYTDPANYRETGYYPSQWAEVTYFLAPNGSSANGLPMYNLYRRVKSLLPGRGVAQTQTPQNEVQLDPGPPLTPMTPNVEMSWRQELGTPNRKFYNRPGVHNNDFTSANGGVTEPRYRFGMAPATGVANDPRLAGLFQRIPDQPSMFPNLLYPPRDLTGQRAMYAPYSHLAQDLNSTIDQYQNDLLLWDVISFEVKAMWDYVDPRYALQQSYTVPNGSGGTMVVSNTDWPHFDYLPLSPNDTNPTSPQVCNLVLNNPTHAVGDRMRVFDTWTAAGIYGQQVTPGVQVTPNPPEDQNYRQNWRRTDPVATPNDAATRLPLRIRIKAIQIRMRVWDVKTDQTRQVTIVQDM